MYLALIPALFVSEGLGGAISKRLTTSFVLIAFKRACALGRPSNDIFAHTNSSSQHDKCAMKTILFSALFALDNDGLMLRLRLYLK
jgi:hypothetical protein